jgi:hypothetical protein
VREIRTLRSVGAGVGDRPGDPVVVSHHDPYSDYHVRGLGRAVFSFVFLFVGVD